MEVKVTVKYSFYRKYLNDKEWAGVTLDEGTTLDELIEKLEIDRRFVREFTVNGFKKEPDTVLSHGVEVVVWPILPGGG